MRNLHMRGSSLGPCSLAHGREFGKVGHQVNASFFMWLVAHNRCWTADRLARRGLPHPEYCPLCDQDEETIDHLLCSCVFSCQVWYRVLQRVGVQDLSPRPADISFDGWWASTSNKIDGQARKGFNTIVILGAWSLWNHCNRCVFDGINPNLEDVLVSLRDVLHLWSLAGARGVSHLLASVPTNE